jgi:membrane-bound ClpP family serine protease
MNIIVIVILVIAAVLLFLVECFIIPGISIASFAAVACLVVANYLAYVNLGMTGFIITLIVSLLACLISIILFMRSKTLDRISLKKSITSSVENLKEPSVKVGDQGTTTTRLALIGYADINSKIIEVTSSDGFLAAKTPIVVERITNGIIYVKKQ